jgi:hypothetical protein
MNKFKTWQDQLLLAVGQGVQRYGFDKRPKGQSFLKNCPLGRVSFHLAFIKDDDDFDVTTDVAIRFEQVEESLSRYRDDPLLTKSEKANTYTLGCELGNLSEGRQKRWTIAGAKDIPVVAGSVLDTFAKIGLPYIEEFSDPQRALEVLSGDGPDSWLHSPLHGERAKRAVSMALHANGREAAQRLAKLKLAFLEERKDFGLSAFREFLDKSGLE